MRLLPFLCLFGLFLLGMFSSRTDTSAMGAGRASCHPAGSKTLAANGLVRVYERRSKREPAGRAVACSHRTGRLTVLGALDDTACFPDSCRVRLFRVKGRLVAFADENGGRSGGARLIKLLDASSGKELVEVPNGTPEYTPRDEAAGCRPGNVDVGIGPSTDLVLRADGLLAWIAGSTCRTDPGRREVHVRAPGREPQQVALGGGIGARSLGLSRAGVHWLRYGRYETAVP